MEIKGKIIEVLPEVSGVAQASGKPWKKREYVLETQDTYPRLVHFDFFGERADQYPLSVGDVINLSFDIESRKYKDRWYTSIRGWRAEKAADAAPAAAPAPADIPAPPVGMPPANLSQSSDSDLPF